MNQERIEVTLGGMKLRIPVYEDPETTLRAVGRVNEALKEVEKGSQRIDTQSFALETAVVFAAQVEKMEKAEKGQNADLLIVLDEITESLRALVEEFDPS